MKAGPPALLFGGYLTGLGTLRCLAAAGIERHFLTRPEGYVRASRFHHGAPGGVAPLAGPEGLEEYLEALPLEEAVLIPCSDEWVQACAALPEQLRARFRFCGPELELLQELLDKSHLERRLAQAGVDRPRTHVLEDLDDLDQLMDEGEYDWFLKPANSQGFRRQFGHKALRVRSLEEARQRLQKCQELGLEMLLQEYVPGNADRHYFIDGFVDARGELLAILARRRIRIHPPDFGDSSYIRSVPLEEAAGAVEACKKLLTGGGFRGIFSAEFKRDSRDEIFRIIEINVRPWAYVDFALSCGMNAPAMAYRDALGLSQQPVRQNGRERTYQIMPNDLQSARIAVREGKLAWPEWLREGLGAEIAVWRWEDPLPALCHMGMALRSRLPR